MAYSKKISVAKGQEGAIEGVIVGLVTAVVIGFVKQNITIMDAATENAVASGVGAVVCAIIVAVERYGRNWMKHKNDGKPAAPVAPVAAEVKK